jgi:hypothetical protein
VLNGGRLENEQVTDRAIYDFRKTQGELLVDAYYRAATQVAHAAGLTVESEAGGPGPPIHQVPVDSLQALGVVDSVRGEFWPDRPNYGAIWVVKETASAAHIYGKRRVHMEAFTSNRHWEEGPQDLKFHGDRAFTEGMNHVVWHTSAHQPPMAGKPGWVYYAGTHLNQNLPWWPMAKAYLSYLGRTSFLLQKGLPVADVLRYYGDQGYNFVPPKQIEPGLGFGYDTDYVNAEVLQSRVRVENGKLVLPDGMRYEVLALPEREDISLPVLQRIEQLVREGAAVAGPKPVRATGLSGYPSSDGAVRTLADKVWGTCDGKTVREVRYGKGLVVCGSTLRNVLAARKVAPDVSLRSPQTETAVDFIHRRASDADIYFLRNATEQWQDVDAAFRVIDGEPQLWDPATGARTRIDALEGGPAGKRVRFRLEPHGAVFVVFRRSPPAAGDSRVVIDAGPVPTSATEVRGPWQVRFVDGPAAPEATTWPVLRSWTEGPDDKLRYFSGMGEYRTELKIPPEWLDGERRVLLDLGDLWAVGDVRLNSRNLGVVWRRPFRVDITEAARQGPNTLEVRVANNWVNRMVGDARLKVRNTKTNVVRTGVNDRTRWEDVPVRKSGLLGPVRVFVAATGRSRE